MCRFIESIKLQDGVFMRLPLHQQRANRAFARFYPQSDAIDLEKVLENTKSPTVGTFKCRIVYDSEIKLIEFVPYTMRPINSLKLVDTQMESLPYKMEDRSGYNEAFAKRGSCDDILLVKNGLITDTSYSNVALLREGNWYTPRIPLLYGVNRAQLLGEGKIIEMDIEATRLHEYSKIALFNAMIEFGELTLDTEKII